MSSREIEPKFNLILTDRLVAIESDRGSLGIFEVSKALSPGLSLRPKEDIVNDIIDGSGDVGIDTQGISSLSRLLIDFVVGNNKI